MPSNLKDAQRPGQARAVNPERALDAIHSLAGFIHRGW